MPVTREFTEQEVIECDLIDGAIEIGSQPWRHGRKVHLVFEHDGAHWAAWFSMHHDEGDQSIYPITGTRVHQVDRTVRVWEAVKEP